MRVSRANVILYILNLFRLSNYVFTTLYFAIRRVAAASIFLASIALRTKYIYHERSYRGRDASRCGR